MNRLYFIKKLIEKNGFTTYLEIGVFLGKVFFFVPAKRKFAVDPHFRFGLYRKFKRIFKSITNLSAKFYQKTSDAFFAENATRLFINNKIDVCLVDGMHEYNFALRDIENTLKFLQKDGVILIHDCNPATKNAGSGFDDWQKRGGEDMWNGDVWKAIVHLRSLRNDINVFVLDCDCGIGVVTFGKPENNLNYSIEEINALSYEGLDKNRKEWLNIKEPAYFFEYFGIHKDH